MLFRSGAQPQEAGVLSVSRETGEALRWTPFSAQTLGHQVDELLRYIHTGEVLGAAGQTFAAIVTAGAALLVYTGIALSIRRFLAWWRRRSRPKTHDKKPSRELVGVS